MIGGSSGGGQYVAPPGKFLVQVYIPEGYMNTEHKNEVHAWVAQAITQVTGTTEPGKSIQTVINESSKATGAMPATRSASRALRSPSANRRTASA